MSKIIGIDLGTTNSQLQCLKVLKAKSLLTQKETVQHLLLSHSKTVKSLLVTLQNVKQ